jgi:hypothetical protein
MSLVLGYASTKECIIMSDGLIVSDGEQAVLQADYNKTFQVNPNVIIGYAGTKDFCQLVIVNAYKQIHETTPVDQAASIIFHSLMIAKTLTPGRKANFIVAGSTTTETTKMITFGTEIKQQEYVPTHGSPRIVSLNPKGVNGNAIFIKHYEHAQGQNVTECMEKTIKEAAGINDTVNCRIFTQTITL